jgi:hypothetical protein
MPGGIATGLQKHVPEMAEMMNDPSMAKIMKSTSQGAATTVWAAIADDFATSGGHYLEDLRFAEPIGEHPDQMSGYAPFAFDQEKEDRLWKISNELVGFKEV